MPACSRACRGITLFEMVIVIGIGAILTALAIPSFRYVNTANRIASESNALLGDLQFARAEAIREGRTISACVSQNGTGCLTGSTDWNSGWIVFIDVNGTGNVDNAADTILRVHAAFTGSDTFIANNATSYIQFNRDGFAAGLTNGTLVTLHASPPTSASTRCLAVTMVGLMQIETYDGAVCT
jgi:type IV fimbrial biogenesis protein FimT